MAAVDFFLKIDGIDGESQDKTFKNAIDLESWSFGATNSGSMGHAGGGGGSGKVKFEDFHFTMRSNKASPKLMLACASGEHIKKAVLTCRKAGKDQQVFLKYTFSDCIVSSFQQGGGSSGEILPTDSISLNYGKIEKEYKAQKPDGTMDGAITAGWNLVQNSKV